MESGRPTRLDLVWYIVVGLLLLVLGAGAALTPYETEVKVGLIAKGLIYLFYFGLFFAFLLLGADYALKLLNGKKKLGKLDPDALHFLVVSVCFGVLEISGIALFLAHPFGYSKSAVAGAGLLATAFVVLIGGTRRYRKDPARLKKIDELPDHVLKGMDDPNEPARWVP